VSEQERPGEPAARVVGAREVERILLGGVPFDLVTMSAAVDAIEELVRGGRGGTVFTPNVDHVVEYQDNAAFRAAYATVDLSLCDGMPVLWTSRLFGRGIPEKVSGSDLVEPVVRRAASRGWRVFLLGGAEGVAPIAAERLTKAHPGLRVVGAIGPRIDMARPRETRGDLLETIRVAAPDIVLVALGAPKQELWIQEVRGALAPAVLLAVGASLDFIAGVVPRAPAWMSRSGLEWLYRLGREPQRLWRRYLVRDPRFLAVLVDEARRRLRG
jgi:N-acetylglucosaminyldiphosphoundecaprenol N-acetyl-beta-D-mannosaminyltransferase